MMTLDDAIIIDRREWEKMMALDEAIIHAEEVAEAEERMAEAEERMAKDYGGKRR